MTDLSSTPRPIHEEYSDWIIEPVEPVGWSATKFSGVSSHTVAAPTIMELRQKLAEVRDRAG
jgi:hypothetical protein